MGAWQEYQHNFIKMQSILLQHQHQSELISSRKIYSNINYLLEHPLCQSADVPAANNLSFIYILLSKSVAFLVIFILQVSSSYMAIFLWAMIFRYFQTSRASGVMRYIKFANKVMNKQMRLLYAKPVLYEQIGRPNISALYLLMKKQHQAAITLVVLILCSLPTHQQLCSLGSSSSASDLLQSGNTIIYNSYSNSLAKRQHSFTFTVNFAVPSSGLQVAASASSLQVGTTNGMDFSIWGSQGSTPNTGIIVLLIDEDNSWANIRVHYLASGRSDFFLGTFSAGVYLLSRQSQSTFLTYNHGLPNWAATQNAHSVIIEISGVKTVASSFVVSLTAVSFNSVTGTIISTINLSSSPPIEFIMITFIVFRNTSPITFNSFNINSGTTAPYQFIGVDQIQNGLGVFAGYGFNSGVSGTGVTCVGSSCPSQCLTSQTCQALSGTLTGANCFICAPGQVLSNGACVAQVSCGANQVYNGTACVCVSGYVVVNSACYISCGVNAYIFNSQCQCFPNYVYSSTLNQCTLPSAVSCGPNFVVQNNVCVCPTGFGLLNSQCVVCPANSFVATNGQCTCSPGYTLTGTTCSIACWPNSSRNSIGQCICNNGFYNQGNTCVPQGNCQNNFVWNGTACACPSGMVVDSLTGDCTYCNQPNRQVVGNVCVCSSTSYPTSTGCTPCIPNSSYNATALTCVCNSGFTLTNGQCAVNQNCPFNSNWNPALQQCVCVQPGQYVINGFCQVCQQFSTWNGSACACNPGYSLNGSLCIQNCNANSTWNGQSCICNAGYYIISGACQLCDPNSFYSNTVFTCVCNNGYFGTWNRCTPCSASCATCNGPSANQCLTCPAPNTLSNGACVTPCSAGFYLDSNLCYQCDASCLTCNGAGPSKCTSCRNNAPLNNGYCTTVCNAGFYLSNNNCLACDATCLTCTGAGPTQCASCSGGIVLNNGNCNTCASGNYLANNRCNRCDSSCLACSGAGPNLCTSCPTNTSLTSNGACRGVCGVGSYVNSANQCLSCMANCGVCTSATTCTSCLTGFSLNMDPSGSTVVVSCVATPTGTSSTITLRGNVLGNGVIYQGVAMSLIPAAILANGCNECDTMFTVSVNSQFAVITTSQAYITNTQYWFVITFDFTGSSFVPNFQFNIKINPAYGTYFSATDLAQVLNGAFTQSQFNSLNTAARPSVAPVAPVVNPTFTSGPRAPPSLTRFTNSASNAANTPAAPAAIPAPTSASGLPADILSQLFSK